MSDYADNLRKSMIHTTRRSMRMVQELKEKDDAALREQVIRMAREAGLYHFYDSEGHCDGITDARLVTEDKEHDDDRMIEMLAPFAALVAAAEREACAVAAEKQARWIGYNAHAEAIAIAIRARGEK